MINKKLFIKSEGNKYFKRNINKLNINDYSNDKLQILISKKINAVKNKDLNILEIGSRDGGRLIYLKKKFPKSNFYGIEPSKLAVNKSNKIMNIFRCLIQFIIKFKGFFASTYKKCFKTFIGF